MPQSMNRRRRHCFMAGTLALLSWAGIAGAKFPIPPKPGSGTLEGTITCSPSHPGAELPGIPNSAPVAAARIEITTQGGKKVTMVQSDSAGRYHANLMPGTYVLRLRSNYGVWGDVVETRLPDGTISEKRLPVAFTIEKSAVTHVDILVRTGLE